jgi:hypothetical protein
MKRKIAIIAMILVLASLLPAVGCERVPIDEVEGPVVTRPYDFTGFTGIEIGDAFELEVTRADTYSVAITAREGLFDRINVSRQGETLKIDLEDFFFFHFNQSGKAVITMPELRRLELSGAAEADVSGFASNQDSDVQLSGASRLDLDMTTGEFSAALSGASQLAGQLTATATDIDLSGASRVVLVGSGGDIRLDGSGASEADLADFPVIDASIELSGASQVSLDVSGRLDVDLSGASEVNYSGNPTLGDTDISAGSELRRR